MPKPSLDDPEYRRRVVRATVVLSPVGFLLAYLLGLVQGASQGVSLLLGVVMFVGCLGAAALFHLRGAEAGRDVTLITIVLRLLAGR
jgi:hypothetical protein